MRESGTARVHRRNRCVVAVIAAAGARDIND
jgi:hypothetical protein